ncbi:TPA: hypothetical protein ACWSZA_001452 [Escherichia coli]
MLIRLLNDVRYCHSTQNIRGDSLSRISSLFRSVSTLLFLQKLSVVVIS